MKRIIINLQNMAESPAGIPSTISISRLVQDNEDYDEMLLVASLAFELGARFGPTRQTGIRLNEAVVLEADPT